ncbi:DUF547 domain-containing protein [soil metagenome]
MNKLLFSIAATMLLVACGRSEGEPAQVPVEIRSGIEHGEFERLLKKYVDEKGLIDYGAWKQSKADSEALAAYLAQYARAEGELAEGNEKAAALTNAYNAFTIQSILSGYPLESIWRLQEPFKGKRHQVGGREVSLDDIEHAALVPLIGYQAHGVLVCAARSCPPLQRFAYTAEKFEEQVAIAYRAWLGREDLNKFVPEEKRVEISAIFEWFAVDFEKAGGIPKVLGRYAPEGVQSFSAGGEYEIKHLPYDWGLNDQGQRGRSYSRLNLFFDNLF